MPVDAVFLDAAGTLFELRESVGHGYSRIGRDFDLSLDPARTDAAFRAAWKRMPPYNPGAPEPDDGRSWWRRLVRGVVDAEGPPDLPDNRIEDYFEALYAYYARPEQWIPFPEVRGVLRDLRRKEALHLAVLSNFDHRLYGILEGLGLKEFLDDIVISSEIGYSKPRPEIFAAACNRAATPVDRCLHAGNDPALDWAGARAAGLQAFPLDRREGTLEGLFQFLG